MQYYDSWPFQNDSRVPHGSKSRKRTDTFRTLGPVKQRLARANGHARYQRRNGGDWSAFVAIAEQLTDDGWQPIDVDLQEYPADAPRRRPRRHPRPQRLAPPPGGAQAPLPAPGMKKEKTVNDDRITYRQLGQLIDGRDRPAAHAIENAARGVNAAEQAIRQNAAMIRAKLGEIEQRLDHGLSLNDLGELQRMPADLDRAVTLRQHHWQVLGALLTEAELDSLQPAAPPAP